MRWPTATASAGTAVVAVAIAPGWIGRQMAKAYITAHGEAAAVAAIRSARWLALLSERLTPKRQDCAVLAGKSTLNRLEPGRLGAPTRYHGIKRLTLT